MAIDIVDLPIKNGDFDIYFLKVGMSAVGLSPFSPLLGTGCLRRSIVLADQKGLAERVNRWNPRIPWENRNF